MGQVVVFIAGARSILLCIFTKSNANTLFSLHLGLVSVCGRREKDRMEEEKGGTPM